MLACRGIRGATTAPENTSTSIYAATRELLTRLIEANGIEEENVAAVYFTASPDLNAGFPAAAARQLGWTNTALMCASEIAVPDSLPRCIRVLIMFNTEKKQRDIVNIYLNGTEVLRLQGVESS
jgi:chorismate mutase